METWTVSFPELKSGANQTTGFHLPRPTRGYMIQPLPRIQSLNFPPSPTRNEPRITSHQSDLPAYEYSWWPFPRWLSLIFLTILWRRVRYTNHIWSPLLYSELIRSSVLMYRSIYPALGNGLNPLLLLLLLLPLLLPYLFLSPHIKDNIFHIDIPDNIFHINTRLRMP